MVVLHDTVLFSDLDGCRQPHHISQRNKALVWARTVRSHSCMGRVRPAFNQHSSVDILFLSAIMGGSRCGGDVGDDGRLIANQVHPGTSMETRVSSLLQTQ